MLVWHLRSVSFRTEGRTGSERMDLALRYLTSVLQRQSDPSLGLDF